MMAVACKINFFMYPFAGVWLFISLIPEEIMVEYRALADEAGQRPSSRAGTITVIVLWIFGVLTLGWIGSTYCGRPN